MQATKQRISTHKRTRNQGTSSAEKYTPRAKEGLGMYAFVGILGGRKVSFTKHCDEAEADRVLGTFE